MFGGFNIADDYFAPPERNGWADLGIVIEGTAIAGLTDWYARLRQWTEREAACARNRAGGARLAVGPARGHLVGARREGCRAGRAAFPTT